MIPSFSSIEEIPSFYYINSYKNRHELETTINYISQNQWEKYNKSIVIKSNIAHPLQITRVTENLFFVLFRKNVFANGFLYNANNQSLQPATLKSTPYPEAETLITRVCTSLDQMYTIERWQDYDLAEIIEKDGIDGNAIPLIVRINLAISIVKDLKTLHQKGFFWGNINPQGISLTIDHSLKGAYESVSACITSLSSMVRVEEGVDPYISNSGINPLYLAPELLRKKIFHENKDSIDLAAAEVWGIGKILHELLCPFIKIVSRDDYDEYWYLHDQLQALCQYPELYDDDAKNALLEKHAPPLKITHEDPISLLVAKMLDPNPLTRPSLDQALELLNHEFYFYTNHPWKAYTTAELSQNDLCNTYRRLTTLSQEDLEINNLRFPDLRPSVEKFTNHSFFIQTCNDSYINKHIVRKGFWFDLKKNTHFPATWVILSYSSTASIKRGENIRYLLDNYRSDFIPVIHYRKLDNNLYSDIVYEFYPLTLEKLPRTTPYSSRLMIAIQLVNDLIKLSSINFVHGDLSPSNIRLKKISEFEMDTHIQSLDSAFPICSWNEYWNKQLTPSEYWSPEFFSHLYGNKNRASNLVLPSQIWSLGRLFLYLFQTKIIVPFKAQPCNFYFMQDLFTLNYIYDSYFLPIIYDKENRLESLIASMLDPKPKNRPTLQEVKKVLSELLDDIPNKTQQSVYHHKSPLE